MTTTTRSRVGWPSKKKGQACHARKAKGIVADAFFGTADPDTIYNPPRTSTAFAAGERSISSGQSLRALKRTEFKESSQVHVPNEINPHSHESKI